MPDPRLGVRTAGVYTTVPTQYADGTAFSANNLISATLYFFDTTNFTPLPPGVQTLSDISATLESELIALIGSSSVIGDINDTRNSLGLEEVGAVGFFDDFLGSTLSTDNWNVDVNGTGAAGSQPNDTGLSVVALNTGTDDDGHATLASDLSFLSSAPLTLIEGRFKIDDIDDVAIEFGLSDAQSETGGLAFSSHATPTAVATDAVVIGYLNDVAGAELGTTWRILSVKNGGTPTNTALTSAPVVDTFVELAVVIALNGSVVDVSFFVNGAQVGSIEDAIAADIPLFAWFSAKVFEGADAKLLEADYIRVFQNR